MELALVMGSIFLPGFVMNPFVAALRERGLPSVWFAPPIAGDADAVAATYAEAAVRTEATTLIVHSNAGNYVPAVVAESRAQRVVFIDAIIPPLAGGAWPAVPEGVRDAFAETERDGILPPWTRWWPAEQVRALFPDGTTFARVDAVAPAVPLSYLSSHLRADPGWADGLACSYVAFGAGYADEITVATGAGWPVRTLDLGHLGMVQDPALVAETVLPLATT